MHIRGRRQNSRVRLRGQRRRTAPHLLTLGIALGALLAGGAKKALAQPYPVRTSNPPIFAFYDKYVDCGGIFIRAAAVVEDRALPLACDKVTMMLSRAPQAKANLIEKQAELHIIGRDQQTSDLPELRSEKGNQSFDKNAHQDIDTRTRGVGNLYSSCGEENLLHLPTDRYRGGSDICIHEFAHDVMDFGLDDGLRKMIEAQHQRSRDAGRWKGLYALTNPKEYWAELSMWYFGAHGDRSAGNGPADGKAALAAYDPDGYALLDKIYSGALSPRPVKVTPVRVLDGSAQLRSISSNAASELVVFNDTSAAFAVEWLDFGGQRKDYGRLDGFTFRVLNTYVTHAWEVKDMSSGRAIRFVADAPFNRLRLGD